MQGLCPWSVSHEPSADLQLFYSCLMRVTYIGGHEVSKTGKSHPQVGIILASNFGPDCYLPMLTNQSPPLHIHFDQYESFQVLSGRVGTTRGWEAADHIVEPKDGVVKIGLYEPHTFWPVAEETQNTTMILWPHPNAVPEPMDAVFFKHILFYLSDVFEGKAKLNPLQVMLMQ